MLARSVGRRCSWVGSVAYRTSSVICAREPGKKSTAKPWKAVVLNNLQRELKDAGSKATRQLQYKTSHSHMIRYAVNDDIPALISFAYQHLRLATRDGRLGAELDQLFAYTFLLIQRSLLRILSTPEGINSTLSTSICFSFANLWDQTKYLGTDSAIASLVLYNTLERWSLARDVDENSAEISKIVANFREKLIDRCKTISLSSTSLHLDKNDLDLVESVLHKFGIINNKLIRKDDDSGYEEGLGLVNNLRQPCNIDTYLGNPYSLPNESKENFMIHFRDQLKQEKSSWIRVDNIAKNRSKEIKISAESLIETWEWKRRLEELIDANRKDKQQNPLKGFFAFISSSEIANVVTEALTAMCSQGQNLIPVSVFEYNLATPILRIVHTKFMSKLNINEENMWSSAYNDYLTYFEDDEISRLHTHRQWWEKCCLRHGLQPDYQSPFTNYQSDDRQQLASFLTQVVSNACVFPGRGNGGRKSLLSGFNIRNVSIEEGSRLSDNGRVALAKMVEINKQLMDQFEKNQFDFIMFPTHDLPMLVPPRPWTDGGVGGPEFTRKKEILRKISEYRRFDINQEMVSRLSSRKQARPVFDALNQLGATPWLINEPMLNVLRKVFGMTGDTKNEDLLNTLSIPLKASTVVIPGPSDVFGESFNKDIISKQQWREYYETRGALEKKRNELLSLWYWTMYRVVLAMHFCGKTLFFPHNMDFRGRVYPISPHLNHMGDDVNRCLLKFAKGRPLGENGLSWLKLHCINLTGTMKRQSVADRMAAVEELMPDILDSANNPLDGKGWWLKSEEPWQTLAACMELRDALAYSGDVKDFVSHLAVHQDGSCNGLQHYAALGRDKQGGEEVNLLPSTIPNDVYSSVATRVEQKRLEDEMAGRDMKIALSLRTYMPQAVPRKVIKQTVMTTVYGVTMYGARQQVKRQLKALGINNEEVADFAKYLAEKTFASLNDSFTSSMQLKDWFRLCAQGCSELQRTVEWVTPLGLPVVQPYVQPEGKKGKLILAPNSNKQIDAFPPNFVHSLDSTHMMLTSLECSRRGVAFAAVHDCFWTHASTVDEMNSICREQFVRLHSQPIVEQCSEWFTSKYLPPNVLEVMEDQDRSKYLHLFSPKVKQGELDINSVKDSVYFFS